MALPVAIFTANFTELWKERKYQRRADYIRKIGAPRKKTMTQKKKDEEVQELLLAIEKEERQIVAAIQSARESVQDAHNSHKHMQILLAQLRSRTNAHSYAGDGSYEENETEMVEIPTAKDDDNELPGPEQLMVADPE